MSKFAVGDEVICTCAFTTCPKMFRITSVDSDYIEADSLVCEKTGNWSEADFHMLVLKSVYESPLYKALL